MADVIGVVSGGISLIQFLQSLFATHNPNIAIVRVGAALDGANGAAPQQAEGTVAQVRLYNENQQIIGNAPGGFVGSGGFHDFSIGQINSQQSTYVQIAASNDAICMPYLTTTWVDGSHYGWVGDFGFECGLDWYFGNVFVDNGETQPKCTWIDGDHTNGIQAGMLFIHWPSFNFDTGHSNNPGDYCGFPAFRAYVDPNGDPTSIFKRGSVTKAKRAPDSRLVISPYAGHNATFLCESETSRGPDFVSLHEGVYCDMETSETLPICGGSTKTGCFDVAANGNVKRDGTLTQKSYTKIIHWD